MILDSNASQKNLCCLNVSVHQDHVKNHFPIRDGGVRVETNNTEHPQLSTPRCNKLLSLQLAPL